MCRMVSQKWVCLAAVIMGTMGTQRALSASLTSSIRAGLAAVNQALDEAEVEVGSIVGGDQIQILSGLEKGDRIAAAGAHHLTEGMKVREYRQ